MRVVTTITLLCFSVAANAENYCEKNRTDIRLNIRSLLRHHEKDFLCKLTCEGTSFFPYSLGITNFQYSQLEGFLCKLLGPHRSPYNQNIYLIKLMSLLNRWVLNRQIP